MFGRPTEIPTAAQAMPGRDEIMQIDPIHIVLGTSDGGTFSAGL